MSCTFICRMIYNKYYFSYKNDSVNHFKGLYKLEAIKNSKSFNFMLIDQMNNKIYVYSYHD